MILREQCRRIVGELVSAIGEQGLYLLIARSLQTGNSVLLSAFLVRRFGLATAGTYAVASFLIPLLTHISSLGLQSSLAREDLTNEERNTMALLVAFVIMPVVGCIACIYSFVMAQSNVEISLIVLFTSVGYFIGQNTVLNALLLLQGRTRASILPPALTTCGILLAGVFSATVLQLAAVTLISQAIGHACLFASMRYTKPCFHQLLAQGKRGMMFLPTDLFWSLAEEVGPMILCSVFTRQDLGLFGLCRQVTRAAEMPSWSLGQVWYVQLVKNKLRSAHALMRDVRRLAAIITGIAIAGSAMLAYYVYRTPVFWPMSCLLALSIPARYDVNLLDLVLRAAGRIRACTLLSFTRLGLSLLLLPSIGIAFGIWGGLAVLAAIAIAMDVVYQSEGKRALLSTDIISG